MNIGDTLVKAGEVIDERGWCQNRLEDSQGRVCAVGALNVALVGKANDWTNGIGWTDNTDAAEALEALGAQIPGDFFHGRPPYFNNGDAVVDYNNVPGRTIGEIREWFAKAAMNAGITLSDNREQQHA